MLWVLLSIVAAFLWGLVAIIDKHAISDELRDPAMATTVSGFVMFVFFIAFGIFTGVAAIPYVIATAILAGVFYNIAIFLYFKALEYEEASRVIPFLMTGPVFVLAFATIFFREVFSPLKYLGISLLVAGAVLISLKRKKTFSVFRKNKTKIFFSAVFGIALLSTLAFAARNLLIRYAVIDINPFSVFFWISVGGLITSFVLLSLHHPKIVKKAKLGVEHVVVSSFLASIALLTLTLAISLHSVSLPTALISTEALFVFVIAVVLSRHRPKIIREELKESTLLMKLVAIILILVGSFLAA